MNCENDCDGIFPAAQSGGSLLEDGFLHKSPLSRSHFVKIGGEKSVRKSKARRRVCVTVLCRVGKLWRQCPSQRDRTGNVWVVWGCYCQIQQESKLKLLSVAPVSKQVVDILTEKPSGGTTCVMFRSHLGLGSVKLSLVQTAREE